MGPPEHSEACFFFLSLGCVWCDRTLETHTLRWAPFPLAGPFHGPGSLLTCLAHLLPWFPLPAYLAPVPFDHTSLSALSLPGI